VASPPALIALALALGAGLAPGARAQKPRLKDQPPNAPVQCPYCFADPELMAAVGVVSHGGFEFARTDTAGVDALLAEADIKWIETEHFEIGLALGPVKVTDEEKVKVRAECARLAEKLPEIPAKPRLLDPWLRAHLYAQRAQDHWRTMTTEILEVRDEDFPPVPTVWMIGTPYWGIGPHLGQEGKYEVILLPSEAASRFFLEDQFGLIVKVSQRWNVIERDSLIAVIHTQQGQLRLDEALHGHFVFHLTHLLFNGYKHYSYQGPIWLREGLAHHMERRVNPEHNTFDFSEGAAAEMSRKASWEPPTLALVRGGEAKSLAQLTRMADFGDLERDDHFVTWSMVDYLVREHPGFLAKLLADLKGLMDEEHKADGSLVPEAQRRAFKEHLGMNYLRFDEAWAAWVLEDYAAN